MVGVQVCRREGMIKQVSRGIYAVAAAAFLLGAPPSLADEFSVVVAKILQSQTDSRIASLDAPESRR